MHGKSDIDVSSPVYDNELINKRIKRTEEEFAKRGIQSSADVPDFIVRHYTFTEEKERTSGGHQYAYRYFPYGFYPFAFGWGYPYYCMTPPRTTEYTEGTLVMDIIDNRSDELLWARQRHHWRCRGSSQLEEENRKGREGYH